MVLLKDVVQTYYRYVRHAMHSDSGGKPLWQLEHDRPAFEDRWFRQQGIQQVRSRTDGRVTCALVFRDREHFIHWLLTWS